MKNRKFLVIFSMVMGLLCFSATSFSQPHFGSPADDVVILEAIWAPASGGGTWVSNWQITDHSSGGGAVVSVYVYLYGEAWRGPFVIWTNTDGQYYSYKSSNLLQRIDQLDTGHSDYYGKAGAIQFSTQDTDHVIQVSSRASNGNYSKMLNGIPHPFSGNFAELTNEMMIMNMVKSSTYRATCGFANLSSVNITVQFRLINRTDDILGSEFTKTINAWTATAFNPYAEAGAPDYSNAWLWINPTVGTGARLYCFGATTNNTTNDPAAHMALPFRYLPPDLAVTSLKKGQARPDGSR